LRGAKYTAYVALELGSNTITATADIYSADDDVDEPAHTEEATAVVRRSPEPDFSSETSK